MPLCTAPRNGLAYRIFDCFLPLTGRGFIVVDEAWATRCPPRLSSVNTNVEELTIYKRCELLVNKTFSTVVKRSIFVF